MEEKHINSFKSEPVSVCFGVDSFSAKTDL